MNLTTIAGHSFDLDRLPERPAVLDVGCRGFDFTAGIRALRPEALIYAMDPDPAIVAPAGLCHFLCWALVGNGRTWSHYATGSTGEGNFLTSHAVHPDYTIIDVNCTNIEAVTKMLPAAHSRWDLVKLDCEGSEFSVLETWPGPIAAQISVEWHDWSGTHIPKPSGGWAAYYKSLFARLAQFGYDVVRHELSDISGRGAWGHWDSTLVLR